MTHNQFMRMVMRSGVATRLLLNPDETRYQIGMAIGILKYHIPPDLGHQQSSPVLPLKFRLHEIKDEHVRKFVKETSTISHIEIVVWRT